MTRRFQPSLFGGLFMGIVSALPIVSAANACCCLWVVLGGLLTVYLQRQAHTEALDAAEAVLGGLVAGLLGAVVATAMNATLYLMSGDRVLEQIRTMLDQNGQMPPDMRDRLQGFLSGPHAGFMLGTIYVLLTLPTYAVFSMLGALLGFALFRRPQTPHPQV